MVTEVGMRVGDQEQGGHTGRARATELTTRFMWESVRLILRDLGHCPRRRSRRGQ